MAEPKMPLEKRIDAAEDRAWLEQIVAQLQHRCAYGSLVVKLEHGQIARVELADPREPQATPKPLLSPRHQRLMRGRTT